jgi:hypothetical protein
MWPRGGGWGGSCNALYDNLRVLEEGHSPGHGVVHIRTHVKRIDTPKGRRVQICAQMAISDKAMYPKAAPRHAWPGHET